MRMPAQAALPKAQWLTGSVLSPLPSLLRASGVSIVAAPLRSTEISSMQPWTHAISATAGVTNVANSSKAAEQRTNAFQILIGVTTPSLAQKRRLRHGQQEHRFAACHRSLVRPPLGRFCLPTSVRYGRLAEQPNLAESGPAGFRPGQFLVGRPVRAPSGRAVCANAVKRSKQL